jgi:hypothetical protein
LRASFSFLAIPQENVEHHPRVFHAEDEEEDAAKAKEEKQDFKVDKTGTEFAVLQDERLQIEGEEVPENRIHAESTPLNPELQDYISEGSKSALAATEQDLAEPQSDILDFERQGVEVNASESALAAIERSADLPQSESYLEQQGVRIDVSDAFVDAKHGVTVSQNVKKLPSDAHHLDPSDAHHLERQGVKVDVSNPVHDVSEQDAEALAVDTHSNIRRGNI